MHLSVTHNHMVLIFMHLCDLVITTKFCSYLYVNTYHNYHLIILCIMRFISVTH